MGDVNVDLNALTTFASAISGLADSQEPHSTGLAVDLTMVNQLVLGAASVTVGFDELKAFAQFHDRIAQSAALFLTDTLHGAASLGAGAQVCAMNYAGTDWLNASTMKKIMADVHNHHRYGAADVALTGSAAVSSDVVTGAFAPTSDDTALYGRGNGPAGGKAPDVPGMTPAQQKKMQDEFDKQVAAQKQELADQNAQMQNQRPKFETGEGGQIGKDPVLDIPKDQAMPSVPQHPSS